MKFVLLYFVIFFSYHSTHAAAEGFKDLKTDMQELGLELLTIDTPTEFGKMRKDAIRKSFEETYVAIIFFPTISGLEAVSSKNITLGNAQTSSGIKIVPLQVIPSQENVHALMKDINELIQNKIPVLRADLTDGKKFGFALEEYQPRLESIEQSSKLLKNLLIPTGDIDTIFNSLNSYFEGMNKLGIKIKRYLNRGIVEYSYDLEYFMQINGVLSIELLSEEKKKNIAQKMIPLNQLLNKIPNFVYIDKSIGTKELNSFNNEINKTLK